MIRFGKLFALGFIIYFIIWYLIDRVSGLRDVTIIKNIWISAIFGLIYSIVMVHFFDAKKNDSKK